MKSQLYVFHLWFVKGYRNAPNRFKIVFVLFTSFVILLIQQCFAVQAFPIHSSTATGTEITIESFQSFNPPGSGVPDRRRGGGSH